MGEDGVDEGDVLKGFAQSHAMGQNGATAGVAFLDSLHALHHAVVHELDALHLMRLQMLADTAEVKRVKSDHRLPYGMSTECHPPSIPMSTNITGKLPFLASSTSNHPHLGST